MDNAQKLLAQDKLAAFYHNDFVESQVEDFNELLGNSIDPAVEKVIDIGGGCGFFALALHSRMGVSAKVIDSDIQSIDICKQNGVDAILGDALKPTIVGDEKIVCFNLILHHLIGDSESQTLKMQGDALSVWRSTVKSIFINEYIYESFIFNDISGWIIYQITSNAMLSRVGKIVAMLLPSLKANTFGVGVRFRSKDEWCRIFELSGFEVVAVRKGSEESVSLARRMLLIKSCRRDSFHLKPL